MNEKIRLVKDTYQMYGRIFGKMEVKDIGRYMWDQLRLTGILIWRFVQSRRKGSHFTA